MSIGLRWGATGLAVLAVLMLPCPGRADTIPNDAGITLGGGLGSTLLTGMNLSVTTDGFGAITLAEATTFDQDSGTDWFSLALSDIVTLPASDTPTIAGDGGTFFNAFSDSARIVSSTDTTNTWLITILFFNDPSLGPVGTGICSDIAPPDGASEPDSDPACGEFSLTAHGWDPNTPISGTANVPEPATAILLLSGLCGLAGWRRRLFSS